MEIRISRRLTDSGFLTRCVDHIHGAPEPRCHLPLRKHARCRCLLFWCQRIYRVWSQHVRFSWCSSLPRSSFLCAIVSNPSLVVVLISKTYPPTSSFTSISFPYLPISGSSTPSSWPCACIGSRRDSKRKACISLSPPLLFYFIFLFCYFFFLSPVASRSSHIANDDNSI